MTRESRKASRDSFALQQARLHFTNAARPIRTSLPNGLARALLSSETRGDIVRDGLLGFASRGVQ